MSSRFGINPPVVINSKRAAHMGASKMTLSTPGGCVRSRTLTAMAVLVVLAITLPVCAQIDTAILTPVGYHPNIVAYYNAPYFSNALYHGAEWYSFSGDEFGTLVDHTTSQFENGYPRSLNAGQKLRALLFGLNINDPFRPAGWPDRARLA